MKAVILAGGVGTRIAEETELKPKPMIEIGAKPLLWHIMKIYAAQGIDEFVVCLGYRGYVIKEYFANYVLHMSDVTIDMAHNQVEVHQKGAEPWKVTLVDTGENTQTGGRLKRVARYIGDEETLIFKNGELLNEEGDEVIAWGSCFDLRQQNSQMLATLVDGAPSDYDISSVIGAMKILDQAAASAEDSPVGRSHRIDA